MATVRERQRWLAALALLVAAPLPLTGIVSWPFLLPFLAVAIVCLGAPRALAPVALWLENVLAPVIVVAVVVAAGGIRYGMLRPFAQLVVLLATVRLPGCGLRARFAKTAAILCLIGVAGIASSTHPALAVYLLVLLVFALIAVGRANYLTWREEGMRVEGRSAWAPARLVVGTTLLALLVAAPLFALLPRLRSPFSAVAFGARGVSGFRDAVALHALGEIKSSRQVALRVAFPDSSRFSPEWLRLVGTTLRYYRAGGWVQGRLQDELLSGRGRRRVALVESQSASGLERGEIVLEKAADTLFVPVGTRVLEPPPGVPVRREPTGGLRIPRSTEAPVAYAVLFGPGIPEQPPPTAADLELPREVGALPALAQSVAAGKTNTLAAALALEEHLRRSYRYVLRSYAPVREDPVQWFLFRAREGHCEFFASSMVLLLRALAIPARLQAGYIGGEPDGHGAFLVRDDNAHAWVLAWVAGRQTVGAGQDRTQGAWRVFDPTPPEGVPRVGGGPQSGGLAALWPRFEAAWDRWILTFGLSDQAELVRRALEVVVAKSVVLLRALPAFVAVTLCFWLLRSSWRARRTRQRRDGLPPVGRAMAAVMDAAAGAGVVMAAGVTPRALLLAASLQGQPRRALAWLVDAHERARYAAAAAPERSKLRRAVRTIERALAAARSRPGPSATDGLTRRA